METSAIIGELLPNVEEVLVELHCVDRCPALLGGELCRLQAVFLSKSTRP